METLNTILRLLAISQLLLFFVMLLVSFNPKRVKIIGTGITLGMISYLSMPLVETYTKYGDQLAYLSFPASIIAELLLIAVWCAFEEDQNPPAWVVTLVVISLVSTIWLRAYGIGIPEAPLWLQLLKVVCAILAVAIVWHGRQHDLVVERYQVRHRFILVFVIMSLVVFVTELVTGFDMPVKLSTIDLAMFFVFTLGWNMYFIKINPTEMEPRPAPLPSHEGNQDPLIVSLLERMESERLYADHDLRVGSLAYLMNVPEYQLRKKINQQLGYRNFNQFVNRYRIEEAGERLLADNRIPVLSVALDVGFRSISSFNTAFNSHYGVSPTQYRTNYLSAV